MRKLRRHDFGHRALIVTSGLSKEDRSLCGKIKIIRVPAGEAPLRIRKEWVGVVMSCIFFEPNTKTAVGAFSGKPRKPYDAFLVLQGDAIEALAVRHPEAAKYWRDKGFPRRKECFSFRKNEIEVVEPVLDKGEFFSHLTN